MDFLLSMNFPELKGEIDGDVVLGVQGPQGKPGVQGPQGIPGPQGEPFTYEDFTPEQLESLRGPQGEPFTYEDFTPEQLEALRGEPGVPGKDGITPHIGENGNWFIGETDTGVAAGGNGSGGNVAYDEAQTLTDEQKAQARENIGAQPKGNYLTEVPEGYAKKTDIPSLDGYAKTTDIPSLDGYAKTEDVPTDAEIIQLIKDNTPESSGGGTSVTGAKVGQTVKIAEVDENGVPTAWEPVDFPSGGSGTGGEEWELIADITLEEETAIVEITKDMDGNAISLKEYYVLAKCEPTADSANGFTFIKMKVNGYITCKNKINNETTSTRHYFNYTKFIPGIGALVWHDVSTFLYNHDTSMQQMLRPFTDLYKENSMTRLEISPNDGGKMLGGIGTTIKVYGVRA